MASSIIYLHVPAHLKRYIACAVVILLAALYAGGTFDRALYPIGLNAHPCGENGFGAVFCGNALKQYDQTARQARHNAISAVPIGNGITPASRGRFYERAHATPARVSAQAAKPVASQITWRRNGDGTDVFQEAAPPSREAIA